MIEKDSIRQKEIIHNPGHRPHFLPRFLPKQGVDVIIIGGMDVKAQKLFGKSGIEAVLGVAGPVELFVRQYVQGALQQGVSTCERGLFNHDGCSHE